MSTRWGYRCETCQADSETTFNHAERELSTLARHYVALKPLLGLSIIDIRALYGSDILHFLYEHDGHAIVLHSEYGSMLALLTEEVRS